MKRQVNRGVARDLDGAELNLQTLAPACRSSQNSVKMCVDVGVSILSRLNWILRASQNLSRIARLHDARIAAKAQHLHSSVIMPK
jgi:hypothetical protein